MRTRTDVETRSKPRAAARSLRQRKAELARQLETLCEQLQKTRASIASLQAVEEDLREKIIATAAELDPETKNAPTQISLGSLRLSITPETIIKRRSIPVEKFEKFLAECPKEIRKIGKQIYEAVLEVKKTPRRAIIRIN